MNATTHPVPPTSVPRDDHDVRLAWACLLSAPLVVVLAFVIGTGIATAMGVEEGAMAPVWVAVIVMLAVVALFAAPVVLVWRFANRARASGDARGRVPAVVLTVFAVAFVAVNLLSWLAGLILDGA